MNRKRFYWPVGFAYAVLLSAASLSAQIPAFPGALGFGAYATGGRGGSVYHVTTLADSGTGSFRDAVSQPNRIIVFDVGGTITLASPVSCQSSLTIEGQTAPGGIAIIGHEVSFSAQTNEIVRYVHIRPGSLSSSGEDGIDVGDGTNMIFDHLSIEFAGYNDIDAVGNTGIDSMTVQSSIIADPMYNGTSAKQGFGAHSEHIGGHFTWWRNLWVSCHDRMPLAKINTIFINNVEYNYELGYTTANTGGSFDHDIINNYFITGPATTTVSDNFFQIDTNQSIYSSGNLLDSSDSGVLSGSSTAPGGGSVVLTLPWSALTPNIPTLPTASAYRWDISVSGDWPYDQADALVISQIESLGSGTAGTTAGTAGPGTNLYYDQTYTGLGNNGYGIINGGIPATDSDGDGMPDFWEEAMGLNYLDPTDATNIAADGYANIEHYLNWLASPHAQTATNTPVDVDLWQFTGGFTNASPVYTVNNATNGTVTLNGDGHTAQFTPATNFFGLASFQFSVAANDGSGCTNTVSVVVVPQSLAVIQPLNLVWVGDGRTNLWGVGSGTNWFNGTNLITFASGDNVTFDDTGSNTPAIDLVGSLAAGTVYVLADDQNYTFAGSGYLAGPTMLFKTGSAQLTLDTTNTFSGGTTINDGVVQIGDGVSYDGGLAGNVTNNAALVYATPGTLGSSVSISGGGTLTETGPGALTLTGTQTYTGPTAVNAGALTFSGSVPPSDITNNGALTLAPSGAETYGNIISGPGSVTANASGILTLSGANTFTGNLTNNGGELILSNNQSAGSGTVVYNGGYVIVASVVVITNNFSIPSATTDLNMMATNSGTATWAGNVVNLGTTASWRPGSDGGTLVFTGTAVQGTHNFIVPRGTVQFLSNAVISATGTATALGRDTSGNSRSANITIGGNANLSLGACSQGGGKPGKWVMVTIQDSALLSTGTNSFDLNDVTASGIITTDRLNGGTFLVGGLVKSGNSNAVYFNGGVLKAGMSNTAFLPVLPSQTNIVQAGGAVIDDGGFAITIAAPLLHDATLGTTADGGLTKLGAGSLTTTTLSYNGPTIVLSGRLAVTSAKTLNNTTNIYVAAGAKLDFSGVTDGSPFIFDGQKLWGSGTVIGNFIVSSGGILAPGSNTVGTLTFSNSFTLSAGSTNVFEISKSPLTNAAVNIYGTATLGGALVVTNVSGTFTGGETFRLVNATAYSGAFSTVTLPALGANLIWNTNQLNTAGTINVVNTAQQPVFGSLSLSNGFIYAGGSNGTANGFYYLLGSTNVALPMSNWMRLATNQFDGNGNFVISNGVSGQPENFYRLQLQ